ncbi:hypothetical protein NE865_01885 [Phthorimaea operculella]|nr:hypothetical protein NE865_01885 [Phthorimaea operculella]
MALLGKGLSLTPDESETGATILKMKRLLSLAAVLALAAARPETYKETEDFNYQRSSSDEGSKSGFYNAQRGNMGGNYERAHNMDGLAQHQMSTAVKQVEGELGDASKLRSGQVFTSAQSGGMFGSGHYDLSNLQGRNFQENSHSAAASQSHSALSSHQSAFNTQNLGYNSHALNSGSHYGGYHQGTKTAQLNSGNLQAIDDVQGTNYGYGAHGATARHSSGVSSQSGYHAQNVYENTNANQYGTHSAYGAVPQNRLIYTAPVRVYSRPGSRVAIPVGVQTYDATHSAATLGHSASAFDQSASTFDQSASTLGHSASAIDHSASAVDHNAINTEAEVLNAGDQHIVGYRPSSNAKHYESSYNYRKQWEKHDVKPEIIALAIPTESPFPENSELYEDAQLANNQYHASGVNSHTGYASSMHNAHSSNVKSSSASQLHQSAIDSQNAALLSNLNAAGVYNSNSANTANALGESDTKPKSYQSSYSYHKSWERQGDPYVIKPVSGAYTNLDAQSLADATSRQGYSHQSGSNYRKTHHQGYTYGSGLEDCDSDGNRRLARSVGNSQADDDLTQQSQTSWSNAEDLRQQAQTGWDFSDSLRLGYPQDAHVQQAQQNQWDNVEDLGQQSQTSWDQSDALIQAHKYHGEDQQQVQQEQWGKLEDLGQQTQNSWDSSDALRHAHNLQHSQTQQHQLDKLEDLGQVQQNNWDSEDLTQQTQQHKWDRQSHSGQEVVHGWPEHDSETHSLHAFENHQGQEDEHKNQVGSLDANIMTQEQQSQSNPWEDFNQHEQTHFNPGVQEQQSQSNTWNGLGQEQIQQGQVFSKYPDDNMQEQQSQSRPWHTLDQQQVQQGQTIVKYAGGKETEHQQTYTHWAPSESFDLHKYNSQHQKEEKELPQLPQTPEWLGGSSYQSSSSYHHNQQVYQHSRSFNSYDWSQAAVNKTDSNLTQLSSLWDKISEVDGQFSASNSQMGREYQSNNVNVNQGKYHGNQQTVVLTSTPKPHMSDKPTTTENRPTPRSPKVIEIPRQDIGRGDVEPEKITENYRHNIGRGDIGPEEDLVEPKSVTTVEESKDSFKDMMKDTSHVANDRAKETYKNKTNLNEWSEEERRNHQHHISNSSHRSWKEENYYSENSSKNQTPQQSTHQSGYRHDTNETDDSNIFNKQYLSSVSPGENQELVPLNQWAQSSLNKDNVQISQQNSDKTLHQSSVQLSELEPMDIQQQQQNMFTFDKQPVEIQQKQQNMFNIGKEKIQQHQHMFHVIEDPVETQQEQQNMFDVVEDPVEAQQQQQNMFDVVEGPVETQQQQQHMFDVIEGPVETQQQQQHMFDVVEDPVETQQQQQNMFEVIEDPVDTQQQQQNMFDVVESPVDTQKQQNMFKIHEPEFEHLSHRLETQLNHNDNLFTQNLEQPVQLTQMQQTGNFKAEPQELDDIYRSNQNLLHTNQPSNQAPLERQESRNIVQQIPQNSTTLAEPTTEKPGLFKRFKNKVVSWFSKKESSE